MRDEGANPSGAFLQFASVVAEVNLNLRAVA